MSIFRECNISLSKKQSAEFLRATAMCGACIRSSYTLGMPKYSANCLDAYTLFTLLRFNTQEDLDRFHEMGFKTNPPDKPVLS